MTMTAEQAHELRQQMYLWCIQNKLCENKEEAKILLKQNSFLQSAPVVVNKKAKPKVETVKVQPTDKEIRKIVISWPLDKQMKMIQAITDLIMRDYTEEEK